LKKGEKCDIVGTAVMTGGRPLSMFYNLFTT